MSARIGNRERAVRGAKKKAGELVAGLRKMARPERFELPTAWFVARYSIQLSYGRVSRREIMREP